MWIASGASAKRLFALRDCADLVIDISV